MERFFSYLPSKTFASVVLSLAIGFFLIVGATMAAKEEDGSLVAISVGEPLAGNAIDDLLASQDTDGDGLKDWEEALWKTSPIKKDTDGDKTYDSDEIKQNRDPLKKAPGDEINSYNSNAKEYNENPTATDLIARDLFSRYSTVKRGGGTLDSDTTQNIVSAVLAGSAESQKISNYSLKDISITKTSEGEGLRSYGNAMGAIVKKYAIGNENELLIFQRAVRNEDEKELAKLDPIIKAYQGMLGEMLKVGVPENASAIHLSLLNSVNGVLSTILKMREVFKDPAGALVSINHYLEYTDELANSLNSVNDFFKIKGITFTDEETGFYYTHLLP